MAKQPTCLVCQKVMEPGILTDSQHDSSVRLPRWCAGEPDAGAFGEVSKLRAQEGLRVVAYRCPECEALRLYAPSPPRGE